MQALQGVAREYGVSVVCGVWEQSPDPQRPYNTTVVVGPHGRMVAAYR
ncbi:MAG: hypothetical protein IMX02_07545 [Limnochordaceae bacterium]|nr:hypothetical protein [Limnochordaceae bacterium]